MPEVIDTQPSQDTAAGIVLLIAVLIHLPLETVLVGVSKPLNPA
ncbi:MAG: hypothetical protein ACREUY_04135 [Burkholderiales bacterium]